ncbi:MAG: hypothetical protein HDS65_08245 [Bacteroidales bacterium]|nr:hypothetical protein [Bacteroidales bacterium]
MINLPPYPERPAEQWPGLTLHEIQMRRALVQARMEIQKFKISAQTSSYRDKVSFFGGSNSLFSRVSGVISIAEYAFLGIKALRFITPFIRRKK